MHFDVLEKSRVIFFFFLFYQSKILDASSCLFQDKNVTSFIYCYLYTATYIKTKIVLFICTCVEVGLLKCGNGDKETQDERKLRPPR